MRRGGSAEGDVTRGVSSTPTTGIALVALNQMGSVNSLIKTFFVVQLEPLWGPSMIFDKFLILVDERVSFLPTGEGAGEREGRGRRLTKRD